MAIEIADAYVAIHTQMPGVKGDIERALGKADARGAGQKIGKQASDGAGKGFAMGGAIAGITAVLTAGAAQAIGALVSEAIKASDATDKFKKTLDFAGIDGAEVDTLTKSTREYADATIYDLSTIQNTVAQLAANGVKDYDQLAEAAGNLNAVAGGNADTYKSVAMAMTQTAGAGKLTTENWNQIANAIPGASGKLQEAMAQAGAYTGNFREAMEKGEISAEEFNAALLELGTSPVAVEAAKSTDTFEGAIGALRATIVGGLMDALNALKPAITGAIGGLTTGLQFVFDFIKEIGSGIDFGQLAELMSYLSPLGLVFKILEPMLPLIADALMQIATVLGGALAQVLPMILPVLSEIVTLFAGLAAQVLPMLMPIIMMLVDVFADLLVALMPVVMALIDALLPIIQALIPVVVQVLDAFMPLITALVDAFAPILTIIAEALGDILVPILEIVVGIIQVLGNVITWLVKNIVVPFLQGILIPIIVQVGQIFQDVFSGLGDFFSGLWEGISVGFKAMVNFIIDLINGFIGGLNEVGNFISDATGGAIDFSVGKLPHLAEGGVISASRGGTLAVVGEGRYDEAVVPLSPAVLGQLGGGIDDGTQLVLVLDDGTQLSGYVRRQASVVTANEAQARTVKYAGGSRVGA